MRGVRRLDYDYDLVSGKVNRLYQQKGSGDQFIYKFDYDADNRMVSASSSRNGLQWQKDASYNYYLHGPLARMELGRLQVQGVDYAYTLQGWMKGINGQVLDPAQDMAGDGLASSAAYKKFGRDVLGFSLGYFNNDYKPIGGTSANAFNLAFTTPPAPAGTTGNTGHELFNANVNNSTIALSKINNGLTSGYSYLFDQLNRLTSMRQHNISGTNWSYSSFNNPAYSERITYDANGNINTYLRHGANTTGMPAVMDNLKYYYYYTATDNTVKEFDVAQPLPGDVKVLSNRLAHVDDTEGDGSYTTDVDDQNAGNYDYDNAGNLMQSLKDSITSVEWNAYGKIKKIVKSSGIIINYQYDAEGHRIVKQVMNGAVQQSRIFYIRDVDGNTISMYRDQYDYVDWGSQFLYGINRLGEWTYGRPVPGMALTPSYDSLLIGSSQYELTNHLGNVMATISDKKIGVDPNTDGIVDYYNADVVTANDYYPFGMIMPGRRFEQVPGQVYKYSINGQEKDLELNENITTALYWEYDSRIARRWNIDPVPDENLSPYSVFENNPITITDVDGDSPDGPGDPVKSKYLNWIGINMGSFGNGVADGLIGALPDLAGFVWDLFWDDDAFDNFVDGLKSLIDDPVGTIKALAEEKYNLWSSVLSGKGTEQQKYQVGKEVGEFVFGIITGAGIAKLKEVIKVKRFEKQLVRNVQKADEASTLKKATEKGKEIHATVEKKYAPKKKGEVAYKDGKKVDGYRPKGTSNPDVRYSKKPNKPKIVYDIKTGKTPLKGKQLKELQKNLPKKTKIKQVIKDENGKYKVETVPPPKKAF